MEVRGKLEDAALQVFRALALALQAEVRGVILTSQCGTYFIYSKSWSLHSEHAIWMKAVRVQTKSCISAFLKSR